MEITSLKNEKDVQELLVECYKSTKLFAEVFFKERFFVDFSPLHDKIFELIDSGAPRIAIAAPRGFGKTSIVGLAYAAKRILFQDSKLLMHVSMSFDAACQQTENLKHELLSNRIIKALFPAIKARNAAGLDESFSKKAWVTQDTLVYPRGSGQQVRGILFHNARPDTLIIDDLENPESITNDDLRRKNKEWFHADLMKTTSRVSKNWQIVYIDTLKHEDSLLEELLNAPSWESIRLEACDDELNPAAPNFMTKEDILAEYNYHKDHGVLDVFYREFRNLPISTEDAVFKPEYFKYYDEAARDLKVYEKDKTELIPVKSLLNVTICDPAKTVKLQSAESAVLTFGVSRKDHKIFVREVFTDKVYPDELYDQMFQQVQTFKSMILAVEVTSLHAFISQPIENEMRVRSIFPIYLELKAVGKKEERIATLAPLYKLGYIYHNRTCCQKLESQLIGFPRSKYWDCMDAEAYITKVMDEYAYYFDPEGMDDEDEELEYEELLDDDDDPLEIMDIGGIWQQRSYI